MFSVRANQLEMETVQNFGGEVKIWTDFVCITNYSATLLGLCKCLRNRLTTSYSMWLDFSFTITWMLFIGGESWKPVQVKLQAMCIIYIFFNCFITFYYMSGVVNLVRLELLLGSTHTPVHILPNIWIYSLGFLCFIGFKSLCLLAH